MSIVQPRLDNLSTCEMTADELTAWGESIKETAKMAYEGKLISSFLKYSRFSN